MCWTITIYDHRFRKCYKCFCLQDCWRKMTSSEMPRLVSSLVLTVTQYCGRTEYSMALLLVSWLLYTLQNHFVY